MKRYQYAQLSLLCLALAFTVGCQPKARIMDANEDDLVASSGAGAPTYDRLVAQSVEKLLQSHSAAKGGLDKLKVAVMKVENKGVEELVDWQEQLYQLTTTSINQSNRYRTVSVRFVDAALRETRLRPDQLFLPKYRRQFVAELEAQGSPVEALLFPTLTTGTTFGVNARQRNYLYTLELVDVETGWNEKVSSRVNKSFR